MLPAPWKQVSSKSASLCQLSPGSAAIEFPRPFGRLLSNCAIDARLAEISNSNKELRFQSRRINWRWLWHIVQELGGYEKVCRDQKWKDVAAYISPTGKCGKHCRIGHLQDLVGWELLILERDVFGATGGIPARQAGQPLRRLQGRPTCLANVTAQKDVRPRLQRVLVDFQQKVTTPAGKVTLIDPDGRNYPALYLYPYVYGPGWANVLVDHNLRVGELVRFTAVSARTLTFIPRPPAEDKDEPAPAPSAPIITVSKPAWASGSLQSAPDPHCPLQRIMPEGAADRFPAPCWIWQTDIEPAKPSLEVFIRQSELAKEFIGHNAALDAEEPDTPPVHGKRKRDKGEEQAGLEAPKAKRIKKMEKDSLQEPVLAAEDARAPVPLLISTAEPQSRVSSRKQARLAEGERDQALALTAKLTQENAELRRQLDIQGGHLAESRRVVDQLMNLVKSALSNNSQPQLN